MCKTSSDQPYYDSYPKLLEAIQSGGVYPAGNEAKRKLKRDIVKSVKDQYLENVSEYVDIEIGGQACLDGYFSASELRLIADAIDKVQELVNKIV